MLAPQQSEKNQTYQMSHSRQVIAESAISIYRAVRELGSQLKS